MTSAESIPEASGFVLLNKPAGMTSFQLLYPLKRQFKTRRVGHAGTLDQEATGLMVTAVGKCTRLLEHIESGNKTYQFRLHLGRETDTLEYGAQIISEDAQGARTRVQLAQVIGSFLGVQAQKPPVYSAIKIAGKRASDLAREGKEVEMKLRTVQIFSLDLCIETPEDSLTPREYFDLICHCSKGTYIRSLGRDIALALGTVGSVSMIHRTAIGSLCVENGQSPADPESLVLLAPEQVLPWPRVEVSSQELANLRQGKRIPLDPARLNQVQEDAGHKAHVFALHDSVAVTACLFDEGMLAPEIQLH